MRKSRAPALRALLRGELSAGATANELCAYLGLPRDAGGSVDDTLKGMPDAYVDRWFETGARPAKVWCVVVPPDDMPKPTRKRK